MITSRGVPVLTGVVGVVLAAGRGERFAAADPSSPPKMLSLVGGRPMVRRSVTSLIEGGVDRCVVVVSAEQATAIGHALEGLPVDLVVNPDPSRGMFSSVQCGVQAAADTDMCVLLPGDMPFVQPLTVTVVIATARETGRTVAPSLDGHAGHPVVVSTAMRPRLLAAPPNSRLDHQLAHEDVVLVPVVDPGVRRDVDRPASVVRQLLVFLMFLIVMATLGTAGAGQQRSSAPSPPPLPVCPADVDDRSSLTAHFDLIRCYDSTWRWDDAEHTLTRAIALFDSQSAQTIGTPQPPADGRLIGGIHVPVPARTRSADADYPAAAYAEGRSGFVILELSIDEKGRVRDATAARSVRGFDAAARRAARRWQYAPTIVNGKAVPVVTFAGMRFGAPGESTPSDWIDLAAFHHANGRPVLARASLGVAQIRLRDDQLRFVGLDPHIDGIPDPAVTPPVKTKHVNPGYPKEAMAARIQGAIQIRGIIDARGRVGRMGIVTKPSLLDGAAMAAVQQWEFTPATREGKPIASVIVVTVNFSMRLQSF